MSSTLGWVFDVLLGANVHKKSTIEGPASNGDWLGGMLGEGRGSGHMLGICENWA